MNWYNKIKKQALQWDYNRGQEEILKKIENVIISNKVNIEKYFKIKYPDGYDSTDKTPDDILLNIQPDVLRLAMEIIEKHQELPQNEITFTLLSDQILKIVIEILDLPGFSEIDI